MLDFSGFIGPWPYWDISHKTPESILSLMDCVIVVKQVKTASFTSFERKASSRKFVRVSEIDDSGNVRDVFAWDPAGDMFQENLSQSYLLTKIAKGLGIPPSVVMQELQKRRQLLLKMVEKNLRDFRSVHKALNSSINLLDTSNKEELEE